MPGYCIHVAHGCEILKKLSAVLTQCEQDKEKDFSFRKAFLSGVLLPDAAKNASCLDALEQLEKAHFSEDPEAFFRTPDLKMFVKKHPLSLEHPMWIGYAAHLYLDMAFTQYLQGIVTVQKATQKENLRLILKCGNTEKTWNSDGFWEQIYDDYSTLNSYLIDRYQIKDEVFAAPDELDSESDIRYIAWYTELLRKYKAIIDAHNQMKKSSKENKDGVILQREQIDSFIKRTANDFYHQYLEPLLKASEETENSCKGFILDIPERKEIVKWAAETVKIDYFKEYWNSLVRNGSVKEIHKDYFSNVLVEIEDVTRSAAEHKRKYQRHMLLLSVLPIVASVLSGIAAALTNKPAHAALFTVLSIAAASSNVAISIITQFVKDSAHKESWLRQRQYYAFLMNETECFCEHLEKYETLTSSEAVSRYMDEIRKLRMQDYSNFFANMGYGTSQLNKSVK